jgi:hypothetical protein
MMLLAAAALAALTSPAASSEQTTSSIESRAPRERLSLFFDGGYLGSGAGNGAALESGLRLAVGSHVATSLDLGYGILHGSASTQDRWWIMPSLAGVLHARDVRFDLGAGAGLGASSGYASDAAYAAAPFGPTWAFQLVPAARAHFTAAYPIAHDARAFARLEAATLLLDGSSIGFRHGNANAPWRDTTWAGLSLGVELGLL